MLFTRCPDCGTTFRVTDDALTKADGQVRCGRCTRVFNAYDEQRDAPTDFTPRSESGAPPDAAAPAPAPTPAQGTPKATPSAPPAIHASAGSAQSVAARVTTGAVGAAPARSSAATVPAVPAQSAAASAQGPPARSPAPPAEQASTAVRPPAPVRSSPGVRGSATARSPADRPYAGHESQRIALSEGTLAEAAPPSVSIQGSDDGTALAYDTSDFGSMSVAEVVAEVELSTAAYSVPDDAEAQTGFDREAMSPSQVERVLETDDLSVWLLQQEHPTRRTTWSAIGSLVAVIVLAAQGVHHYRSELANSNLVGPMIKSTYSMFGVTVTPRWDIRQYEILDWVATAAPSTRGQGSLRITAHIKNRGPQHQPYPSVQLELKDRWESAVGTRVFAPREYLTPTPRDLMAPGETARAEIEVVDPGSDAYGFELDVCIEVETHELSCGSDKVFL
jgi:predicted Zn finger-like uncharacterized protein